MKRFAAILLLVLGVWAGVSATASARPYGYGYYGPRPYYRAYYAPRPYYRPYGYGYGPGFGYPAPYRAFYPGPAVGFGIGYPGYYGYPGYTSFGARPYGYYGW